jgi:hypothetical protein
LVSKKTKGRGGGDYVKSILASKCSISVQDWGPAPTILFLCLIWWWGGAAFGVGVLISPPLKSDW